MPFIQAAFFFLCTFYLTVTHSHSNEHIAEQLERQNLAQEYFGMQTRTASQPTFQLIDNLLYLLSYGHHGWMNGRVS